MTANAWQQWGRELTPEDAARFARSRRDKTAGFETLKGLGCRVKEGYRFPSGDKFVTGDGIGFPRRTTFDGKVEFGGVKVRHMDRKLFAIEHNTAPHSLYNLDTVNSLEDVYVVEGEPDVAVMEEAGFRAVSVTTGSQKKYDKQSIYMLAAAKRIFIVGDQGAKKPWETDPGEACMDALQKELTDHSPETAA